MKYGDLGLLTRSKQHNLALGNYTPPDQKRVIELKVGLKACSARSLFELRDRV